LKNIQVGLEVSLILLVSSLIGSSYAQSVYLITIPEGADNPDNQYFWFVGISGDFEGQIAITKGESVRWENQDDAAHTVTSGNPQTGPDGIFDSELFGPKETFTFEFTKVGEYPYYCVIHPWMVGNISVSEPYVGRDQVLKNVGSEFDENGNGWNVEYTLEGTLEETVQIDPEQNSITFYYDPLESKEDVLIIRLPESIIEDIQLALVNGEIEGDSIRSNNDGITTMWVPLWPDSREVTFVGSKVISKEVDEQKASEVNEEAPGGGCLIATATYGSELSPQVQQLRELRDTKLLQTELGASFMHGFNDFYYSFSPKIADYERENPTLREIVKITITPLISSLSLLNNVNMDSEAEVLGYGISLILLNVGIYFVAPVVFIAGVRRKF